MEYLTQILVAAVSVGVFGVVLDAPRRSLPYSALIGALSRLFYLLLKEAGSLALATFCAAATITLCAQLFARLLKMPATVFLIPALYLFVPGTSIYRSVFALLHNNQIESMFYLNETIVISGAIATAVFMVDSLFIIGNQLSRQKERKI